MGDERRRSRGKGESARAVKRLGACVRNKAERKGSLEVGLKELGMGIFYLRP